MTDLFIYGDIGEPKRDQRRVSADAFLAQLARVPATERINVRIHSNGGSVSEAAAIFNAIKSHRGGADTQIDGIAASAAAYIAMAGQTVRMAGNAMLMIHNVSSAVAGNAEEMRRAADVVDQFSATIVPAFASRTGLPAERIVELMKTDTYLTATQARAFGFVDEITGDLKLAASLALHVDGSPFDKRAEAMSDALTITAEDKSFLTNLRNFFTGKGVEPLDPVAVLTADLTASRQSLTELTARHEAAVTSLTAMTAERDAALAKVETPEALEARIDKEVVARLAAAGVAPIARDPQADGKTTEAPADVLAQWQSIEDATEKQKFFTAHKEAIYLATASA